ncbi:hypothetical protein K3N28_02960 [Glycomyces sp. TRM65418]|uniref:hypothetical protein n=1 Tax=Glycomyces sp. TRM65418 TaxID=2867006 RepID=UPI001CE6E4E8|nr:hypothetical protein [Glycomyces sp. TRM65418]MCC3762030.1 hypothetical protein [Glycomyces sp. TRM65418]QZD56102.1 hypothetical protein K3N28_02940 [Glycomyces sp. TRM65418]
MSTRQHPYLIPVRLGTGFSVLYLVAGGLFLIIALLTMLAGAVSFHLVLGPLFLLMGILSFFRPYCVYDAATGALHLYSPLGFQLRTYGAPRNERIYFDPANAKVMRALPNGRQRKVTMVGVNRDELARMLAALPQHRA